MSATPVWAQVAYLVAAVCFILALKGLSSPRTARAGNLVGAVGAVLACVVVFFYAELDHVVPIVVAIAAGTAVGLVAVVLATVNMVGGFVVTDRMLQMFTRKRPAK